MRIKDSKVKLAGGAVIYYMNYTNLLILMSLFFSGP